MTKIFPLDKLTGFLSLRIAEPTANSNCNRGTLKELSVNTRTLRIPSAEVLTGSETSPENTLVSENPTTRVCFLASYFWKKSGRFFAEANWKESEQSFAPQE